MLTMYIISAVVGGVLVLLSALGGDHDSHAEIGGHELDHDGAHDGEASHGHWIPFLSLRFWTYFFAAMGITGILLTKLTDTPSGSVAWMSVGTGLASGLAIAVAMQLMRRSESNSGAAAKDLLGCEAKVLVAIRPGQAGQVRANCKGDIIDFLAVNEEGATLEAGASVIIVATEGDRLSVVPRDALFDSSVETVRS